MLGMPEFPSSSLRILSRSCYMGRTRRGTGREWGRARKGAREAPSVQNLREFVTPSRNTLAHVVEEIAKFPTGLLRHVSIPQRGCFPPTSLFPPTLPVVCYAKILTHSLVQMSMPAFPCHSYSSGLSNTAIQTINKSSFFEISTIVTNLLRNAHFYFFATFA